MLTKGALEGVKVLDLSRMLPGPYCSMILADHGADVVAIEDKRFQTDGLFFNDLNRNKRHMSLNLKAETGRKLFYQMAKEADVILEGFRPGVVERLGVDYKTIKTLNPRIIYCSITGYGQTGPLVNQPGHDVNYLSYAGLLDLIGEHDNPPTIPGVQIADIAGGSMNAAVGILLALYSREKTGVGQYIDISMTDGVIGLLSLPYFFSQLTGKAPQRSKDQLSHRYGCYNTYQTKDGRYLAIGAVELRFWKNLCEQLGLQEYIEFQYDETRKEEIIDTLRQVFKTKNLADWEAQLGSIDACFSPIKTMSEILEEPLFREREMVHTYQESSGTDKHGFGIPVKLSDTPGTIRTTPCLFGADTKEILGELGCSEAEIDNYFAEGIV